LWNTLCSNTNNLGKFCLMSQEHIKGTKSGKSEENKWNLCVSFASNCQTIINFYGEMMFVQSFCDNSLSYSHYVLFLKKLKWNLLKSPLILTSTRNVRLRVLKLQHTNDRGGTPNEKLIHACIEEKIQKTNNKHHWT